MNVSGFCVYRYRLPMRRPFSVRGTPVYVREGLLIRLRGEDGAVGWGEASPIPGWSVQGLDETAEEVISACRDLVDSTMDARVIMDELCPAIVEARPAARFGLECACLNLVSSDSDMGLRHALSERPVDSIRVNALLSGSIDEQRRQLDTALERGFAAVKAKVGRGPIESDIALVRSLHERIGGRAALRLDANRAWSLEEATIFARETAACDVAYIEEPLADAAHVPAFIARTGCRVAVDETLVEDGASVLDRTPGLAAVVVKPTLVGGVVATIRIAAAARRRRVSCILSSSLESGVGIRCLAELASGAVEEGVCHGLDTLSWFEADAVDPAVEVVGGTIRLPEIENAAMMLRERVVRELAHG